MASSSNGGDWLRELRDREEIRSLAQRYFELMDNGAAAELKDRVFTPDGRLIVGGTDIFAPGAAAQAQAGLPPDPIVGYTHCLHQSHAVIAGDRGFGEVYATAYVMSAAASGRRLMARSIRYFDRYERTADGWRIADRRHSVHWMYEVPLEIALALDERDSFTAFLAEHGVAA